VGEINTGLWREILKRRNHPLDLKHRWKDIEIDLSEIVC
jgi:hypothetical protein